MAYSKFWSISIESFSCDGMCCSYLSGLYKKGHLLIRYRYNMKPTCTNSILSLSSMDNDFRFSSSSSSYARTKLCIHGFNLASDKYPSVLLKTTSNVRGSSPGSCFVPIIENVLPLLVTPYAKISPF